MCSFSLLFFNKPKKRKIKTKKIKQTKEYKKNIDPNEALNVFTAAIFRVRKKNNLILSYKINYIILQSL